MRFITSAEWGANQSKDATADTHPIGTTRGVTLHWTGNRMGITTHADCDDRVRGIERSHEYGNGWGDIAYNLLACPHGYVFEGRGAGVRSAANGDTGPNLSHYAVCYLGGQGDPFTSEGKQAMRDAVAYLRSHGAGPEVNGHRDHKATTCPGDEIYRWLQSADFNDTPQEDDMPTADEIAEALARAEFPTFDKNKDGENIPRRFDVILAQTHFRAQGARAAAAAALQGQNELAKLIRTLPGAGEDLRALADDIVARTAAEVDRLDAEAVAERLEITPKEKP